MVLDIKPLNCAYIRTSIRNEDPRNQEEAIKKFTKEKLTWFKDIEHGDSDIQTRPGFRDLLNYIKESKPGKLYIYEISRIGRNHLETLSNLIQLERELGVQVISVSPTESWINNSNKSIRGLILSILSWTYEQELINLRRRTREALEWKKNQIKENGFFISSKGKEIRKLGRPERVIDWGQVQEYELKGISLSDISRILNLNYQWFLKKHKEHEIGQGQKDLTK